MEQHVQYEDSHLMALFLCKDKKLAHFEICQELFLNLDERKRCLILKINGPFASLNLQF